MGVVIGWLLGVTQQVVQWYLRRRQAIKDNRDSVRRAARLLENELENASYQLAAILDGSVRWAEVGFPITAFDNCGEVLLDSLSKPEWDAIARARRSLDQINAMTAYRDEADPPRLERAATEAFQSVQTAIDALSESAR